MKQTNKNALRKFKRELLTNNYTKVILDENKYKNTEVLSLNKEHKVNYVVDYTTHINALRNTPLDKRDIINLKKYASFYKYWLDLQKQTISIQGQTHNIYKVKGNLYFRNRRTGKLINATKEFKLAREMNKYRPAETIMSIIKQNEEIRRKYKKEVVNG